MADTGAVRERRRPEDEGGIAGWFRPLFGPDQDEYASQYSHAIGRGRCVVAAHVHSDEEAHRTVDVMHQCGALDVEEHDENIGHAATDETRRTRAPIVEEELKVGKRTVDRGAACVFTRTSETPVEQDVHLRNERTIVRRVAADRPATQADLRQASGGTIEVRQTAEEPVVEKTARVVGENERLFLPR